MALFSSAAAIANITKITPKQVEPFQSGREYKTYHDYQVALGTNAIPYDQWEGQDMYWLRRDRELSNHRWHRAAHLITSQQLQDYFKPFEQINSYYKLIHYWIKGKKHESKWVSGAYYLVNDLTDAYQAGLVTTGNWFGLTPAPALALLIALNKAIVNYAIQKFYDLLYGQYANSPRKGNDAWVFDRDLIIMEQGTIAFPAYDQAGPDARATVNGLFNDQGFLSVLKDMDVTGIYIPVFPQLYNSDLTNSVGNYGQDARIQVPLAMLYPNSYFYNDSNFAGKPLANAIKNGEIYDRSGATSKATDDAFIYFAYIVANHNIMNVFN